MTEGGMEMLKGILCPYCGEPTKLETYIMEKGRMPETIIFCDNDECSVKPCTDATRASLAIADAKSWR